jgi:hypothetical protein
MPYSVDVVLPSGSSGFEKNQWLQVSGQVTREPRGRRTVLRLVADAVEPIDRPADAYG